MKKRLLIISFLVLLMVSAIVIVEVSLSSSRDDGTTALVKSAYEEEVKPIYAEEKLFERAAWGNVYKDMPDTLTGKTAEDYHNRRAYPGAPPTIPHRLFTKVGIGENTCLQCHKNGGYVPEFESYAPVTPHPEMINCRQCHVPVTTDQLFKETDWTKEGIGKRGKRALVSSPPMVPHPIQMRENCASCHSGPGAREDIRTSHPERINCRQCHVPDQTQFYELPEEFSRSPKTKE